MMYYKSNKKITTLKSNHFPFIQVADFGLARWHSEWNINTEEDRVVGTSGYLSLFMHVYAYTIKISNTLFLF